MSSIRSYNPKILIPNLDPWLHVLCQAEDLHSLLKNSIIQSDAVLREVFSKKKETDLEWEELISPFRSILDRCGYQAVVGGREYAASFLNHHTKMAQLLDWDYKTDIEQMISGMGYPTTKKAVSSLRKALEEKVGPPVHELTQIMGYEQAKAIARTVMMNIYVKSALRRWEEDGIEKVKRMEIRDKKTCPICRALNGKEYEIADIVNLTFPLTQDSHYSCRGSFSPLISLATYNPKQREIPLAVAFDSGLSRATNVPVEVSPWLRSFLRKLKIPMQIDFDPTISEAYSWDQFDVKINPSALEDEDVREIILSVIADQMWPQLEKQFEDEYMPLLNAGLARPAKSFESTKDLFINNYTAYKMGQDPDPFSNNWWNNNIG